MTKNTRQNVSNLVFYAQSTSTVTSERPRQKQEEEKMCLVNNYNKTVLGKQSSINTSSSSFPMHTDFKIDSSLSLSLVNMMICFWVYFCFGLFAQGMDVKKKVLYLFY